jgi:signal transduction histidine kinase
VIRRNTERLDRLVQDLLLVTQIEAGTFEIAWGVMDISGLVRNAVEDAQLNAEGLQVNVRLEAEPIRPFAGDPTRMGQVLDNLLSNALKFTPPGGTIRVGVRKHGKSCLIEVADTGPGIEPDDLEHLFDRFYRTNSANRAQVQGVGLGLAITKTIVDAHGGEIAVESEPGAGTTFTVSLPIYSARPHERDVALPDEPSRLALDPG